MNKIMAVAMAVWVGVGVTAWGQQRKFDLLIQGGHVIDARNGVAAIRDVAIADGKIAQVAEKIPAAEAQKVVDARGLYVTPGLIDIHAHVFHGTERNADYSNGLNALPPDGFTFRSGVTTVVDVGGAGWRNFIQFKEQTIDRAQTRVLALLNIVGSGMKGGPVEQNLADMDARLTAMRARQFADYVVGIKLAHYQGPEWQPVDRAVEAGKLADVPVMVDFGGNQPPLSMSALLLEHLRPGDILTHMYAHVRGRMPLVNAQGQLEPFAPEARKRGIIFDVGHGGGSFLFRQAVPALKQGFVPDTISTDLHIGSMNAGMKDQLNVMSKLLNLGISLEDVIAKSTWRPAQVIRREALGHLSPGAVADLTVLRVREGQFGFIDSRGARMGGTRKLECELTVRAGRVVWDLNGLASPEWTSLPPTY
jgi:dihydroorotase